MDTTVASSKHLDSIPLEDLQRLYDQGRYLEAFQQTADIWRNPPNLEDLSVDELILGGRLANRLGGWRGSRWLLRAAHAREPLNPRVRYFARGAERRSRTPLSILRELEANPTLVTDDAELQASWLASHAVVWARLRDFTRAYDYIEHARGFCARDGWVSACESEVLAMADRWEDALEAAEIAWDLSSKASFAAHSLGSRLLRFGRVREAAERIGRAAESSESYEVVNLACWHHCALADTVGLDERRGVVDRALSLVERLPGLAPLADKTWRSFYAHVRLDVAQVADDHEEMERWAREVRSPFHHRILDNLRKNPAGSRIRLPFRGHLQKHMTCLPASVASALSSMNENVDADVMAAEVTYGGTTDWAAADWLESRGYAVRFFVVTAELARRLIRNGIAFVLGFEGDDSAHAVAVVGLDESAGTLLLHDPVRFRTVECLLEFLEEQSPLGPHGMVVVPREELSLVDQLLPAAEVETRTAFVSFERALQLHGPTVASIFVTELEKRHPSHPITAMLLAMQAAEEGRTGDALVGFRGLLETCPAYPPVRARLLHACQSLGNTALLRDTLESVVERGLVPGVQSQQEWLHPPARYVWQYADLLRVSAATRGRARALLHSVIRRDGASGEAWHVLGDALWHDQDFDGALLAYRLASCLAENNEHYAHAYAESLGIRGRAEEALAWLEKRVRAHGGSARATGAWITWMVRLETSGHPAEALSAGREALQKHGNAPELLAFLVPLHARMGQWEDAAALLGRLESAGNPALFHQAAVEFHGMKGDLDESLRHAEAWVRELPLYLGAKGALLDGIAARDGARAAMERAARWVSEEPGCDGLEELCCAQLDRAQAPPGKKALLLRRRLKRNPEDGWAWRELAFLYLETYGSTGAERRGRLDSRIAKLMAECDRTAPQNAATLRAKALWLEMRGAWRDAVSCWLEWIDRDPAAPEGYRRAFECSARLDENERIRVWQRLEAFVSSYPGKLRAAREVIALAAVRFGVPFAEEAASRWMSTRPDDPELIEAVADLLLVHGHGRTDAERALAMLQPAVERFPFHLGLRCSLLHALRKLGRFAQAEEVVREILRRHPANAAARIQLAWIHELGGRGDEARRLLEEAIRLDPWNADLPGALVKMHVRNQRLDDARSVIRDSLKRLPTIPHLREGSIRHLVEWGDEEEAVRVAREGVREFPREAYLWYVLGDTLERLPRFAASGEVEDCFRRSHRLDASFFASADRLALLLADQRRFQEAEDVARSQEMRHGDPSPFRGRLAWIHREQGRREEAREELTSVLREFPWYHWGWSLLMAWLQQDKAWDKAKNLLRSAPPPIRNDVHLMTQRLRLLQHAGLAKEELDFEWNRLLCDFSEDVSLHLERYDSLREAARVPEAAALLRKAEPLAPDDPFLIARLVEVLARERKKEEAIQALLRVVFRAVEPSEWPVDFAWSVARNARFADDALRAVRGSIEKGSRPTPHALSVIASYALEDGSQQRRRQPRWRTLFPDAGARNVMALLKAADGAPWMDGRCRAILLRALTDYGYGGLVVRYWRTHRAEVERDVGSWAEAGRALLARGGYREAREVLASWRDRRGVSMWMVVNYVESLLGFRAAHLKEIRSTCAEALAGLPHDGNARYLAHAQAEACALLDDEKGFLETWQAHPGYFDGVRADHEWFSFTRVGLLDDVPAMVRFLEEGRRFRYRWTLWRLRVRHVGKALGLVELKQRWHDHFTVSRESPEHVGGESESTTSPLERVLIWLSLLMILRFLSGIGR
jgi:tetratricopeptide (TPR) repeat protein